MEAIIHRSVTGTLNLEIAKIGLEDRGYIVSFTDKTDIELPVEIVCYGNVGWINALLKHNGFRPSNYGFVPEPLKPWGIPTELTPTKEIFKRRNFFVKPDPKFQKAFNGFVVKDHPSPLMLNLAGYRGDFVLVSPIVNILSEWRCFVMNGTVVEARHYKGDFRVAPTWKAADEIVKTFTELDAWSFDLAVLDSNTTVLLEMHEVFSLGTYGINPNTFASMLETAWAQKWKEIK